MKNNKLNRQIRPLSMLAVAVTMAACSPNKEEAKSEAQASDAAAPAVASQPAKRIVQGSAPGKPSRKISTEKATDLSSILFTQADVEFMQGMIMHHAQALDMTALVAERSENPELVELAERIELSQSDEIKFMQRWLREREQTVTGKHAHHHHGAKMMAGMLTKEQMDELAAAKSNDFDKLFLQGMIQHHQGAIVMVRDLYRSGGAAQESVMFGFVSDVESDQKMEIDRMGEMLAALSPDPRVGLKGGYLDAESASMNMELLHTQGRPAGFYSPKYPAGIPADEFDDITVPEELANRPPIPAAKKDGDEHGDHSEHGADKGQKDDEAAVKKQVAKLKSKIKRGKNRESGSALFNFANTDIAFTEDKIVVGNYHGFNIYDIANPDQPEHLVGVVCPGGQGDVSVVGDLLIMSVEQSRGRLDCGLQGVKERVSDERMRGIRIFDISDIMAPKQVAAVQTCRGSHTHTVVNEPNADGDFYVYVSGTARVREEGELARCSDKPLDQDSALFSIDVVEININRPEDAKVVNSPRIFADDETGKIAGLWTGGDHGDGTQRTSRTDQCHDITVFPEMNLAAGACSGNGILMDISDPINPKRLDAVVDKGFAYWHSATFNNDGTKVVFTDEWGGGGQPRCRASDPKTWGANAIYDIVDNKLVFRSYYKLPAPQNDKENCVAHNGSLVPVPGRDIMIQAWYQGGLSVYDFTDSSNPYEIAYFDRGPLDPKRLETAGFWSAYWNKGRIYGAEIARGLDVLALTPSEFLSENELAASETIDQKTVNAQYQVQFSWPQSSTKAKAYIDQLERAKVFTQDDAIEYRLILSEFESNPSSANKSVQQLAEKIANVKAKGQHQSKLDDLTSLLKDLSSSMHNAMKVD